MKQVCHPGIENIVKAIAEKDGIQIANTAVAIENFLNLSTQVPMKYVFLTDGPSKVLKIGKTEVRLKYIHPSIFKYKSELFRNVVILLSNWKQNKKRPTKKEIDIIKGAFDRAKINKEVFNHDIKLAPIWIASLLLKDK